MNNIVPATPHIKPPHTIVTIVAIALRFTSPPTTIGLNEIIIHSLYR